jgi:hypothetical protein
MKKSYVFILLILPAVLVFTAAILHYAYGPYWMGYNSDPEYLYLISSLSLVESKHTSTIGNPGTTLQILGAATMKISHALNLSGKDNLESAVLKNPEFYLTVINIVLIIFNTMLLFIIGLVSFNLTKNIWPSLLLQFSPFFSTFMLTHGLTRISPEPILLFSGLLFVLILVKMVLSKNFSESAHWYMIALALVSGFGIATKLTFVPLLIIPLFVLPTFRNKILFLFFSVISFVLCGWPIISQYEILFNWYYSIITHTGFYGLGNRGILDTGTYLQNIVNLFLGNPLFFLIWLFSAGFILMFGWFSLVSKKLTKKETWQDRYFMTLAAVTVAQLCSILIIAKHPAERYLLPVMTLSGFMLFLIFLYLQRLNYFSRHNINKFIFFIIIFFIFSSVSRVVDIKNVFMNELQIKQESLAIYDTLENKYKNYLKISYSLPGSRSSSPLDALAFGNFFIANGLYSESLQKIYGEAYFYNVFNGKFNTWRREFSIEDIISKGHSDRVIFHGPPIREHGNKIVCASDSDTHSWMKEYSIDYLIYKRQAFNIPIEMDAVLYLRDVFGGRYQTIYIIEGILQLGAGNSQQSSP